VDDERGVELGVGLEHVVGDRRGLLVEGPVQSVDGLDVGEDRLGHAVVLLVVLDVCASNPEPVADVHPRHGVRAVLTPLLEQPLRERVGGLPLVGVPALALHDEDVGGAVLMVEARAGDDLDELGLVVLDALPTVGRGDLALADTIARLAPIPHLRGLALRLLASLVGLVPEVAADR